MIKLFSFVQRLRYILLLLLLAGLAMTLLAYPQTGRTFRYLPETALELAGPFQQGLEKTTLYVERIWDQYLVSIRAQEENRALREIIEEMKKERVQLLEARAENYRLRTLLTFRQDFPEPLLPAKVIGRDLSAWFHTLVIDRGREDGVEEGMAVLSVEGIVGQIMDSSGKFSRVLLITDPNSGAAAVVQRTRARGIAEGSGLNKCRLKYLHQSDEVAQGDQILTSGLDGVYPEGNLIGTVTRVQKSQGEIFQEVMLQPAADLNRLEEVLVRCKKPERPQLFPSENANDPKH